MSCVLLLRARFLCLIGLLALAAGIVTATAQSWPTRFVTLVVPFGAGSASDTVARILAARLSEILGQQMIPTAAEQGLNVVDGYYWMGLFLPKGAPEGVVTTLNRAIGTMLDTPAVAARLKDVATTAVPPARRSTAYLQKYVETETVKWAGIMKSSNVPQQ